MDSKVDQRQRRINRQHMEHDRHKLPEIKGSATRAAVDLRNRTSALHKPASRSVRGYARPAPLVVEHGNVDADMDANLIDLYDETEITPLASTVAHAYDDAAPLADTTIAHDDTAPLAEAATAAHDATTLAEPTTAAHGGAPPSPKTTLPKRDLQDPLGQHGAQQPEQETLAFDATAEMSTSGGLPDNLKAAVDAQVTNALRDVFSIADQLKNMFIEMKDDSPARRGDSFTDSPGGADDDADIEDNEDNEDAPPTRPPKKLGRATRHRDPNMNVFLADIRKHAMYLMGRDNKDDPFNMIASRDDVDVWDADETEECCDEESFLPSLEEPVKSPYNQSCARIFEASFKAEHPYWAGYNYDVRKAFTTHLDYLKKMHKKMISSSTGMEGAAQDKSKWRRRERKYQLFQRRYRIAGKIQRDSGWAVKPILSHLRQAGMSSDESDHSIGQGEPIYLVKVVPWRSSEVTTLLRTLDAMHLRERYGGERNASSGAWPHFRTPHAKTSKASPVKQLPRNFYNPLWMGKIQGTFQLKELHALSHLDLMIPVAIQREAAKYDLCDRQVVRGAART